MDTERIAQAVERIEAARARLERAARTSLATGASLPGDEEGLRKVVADNLARLDSLIDRLER